MHGWTHVPSNLHWKVRRCYRGSHSHLRCRRVASEQLQTHTIHSPLNLVLVNSRYRRHGTNAGYLLRRQPGLVPFVVKSSANHRTAFTARIVLNQSSGCWIQMCWWKSGRSKKKRKGKYKNIKTREREREVAIFTCRHAEAVEVDVLYRRKMKQSAATCQHHPF